MIIAIEFGALITRLIHFMFKDHREDGLRGFQMSSFAQT